MACGLPTIGTRWSGNLDFMDDGNSLLVEIEGLVSIDASGAPISNLAAHHRRNSSGLE